MSFDLSAALKEAGLAPFDFEFEGVSYQLPADMPLSVIELMASGEPLKALAELIGDDHLATMQASGFGDRAAKTLLAEYRRTRTPDGDDEGKGSASSVS